MAFIHVDHLAVKARLALCKTALRLGEAVLINKKKIVCDFGNKYKQLNSYADLLTELFDAHCCHMGTAKKHPVTDGVKPVICIF